MEDMKIKIPGLLVISLIVLQNVIGQVKVESADIILKQAYNEAVKSNKNVFVIFHASWCGWCHKLDSSMNDASCKKYFDDNYVIRHLTVFENPDKKNIENPGAEDFLNKYNDAEQDLPYFLIFNKQGELIADSKNKENKNIGCPATEDEVQYFILILEKTSRLNKLQLSIIEKRFAKNSL